MLPAQDSNLAMMIRHAYGSFDNLIDYTNAEASAIEGSGWMWLAYCKMSKNLELRLTKDQNLLSD